MKAVILAGGKGTRLRPLTDEIPKPLVNIIDKPVMEHIINLLKNHGITEIAVTLGYKSQRIIDRFGDGRQLGVDLTYFVENTPLGTAGSVKGAESFLSQDFIVISGDAYTDLNVTDLMRFHYCTDSCFTLVAKYHENPIGLGLIETDFSSTVTSFIEKPKNPAPSLVNTGIYVINKEILRLVPNGFYDFGRQLLPRLVGRIRAYVTNAYWSDIGTLESYYMTNYTVGSKLDRERIAAEAVEL